MCGLAGLVDFKHQSKSEDLKKMTDVLVSRGPDDSGYFFFENEMSQIGLGHRRLSILDLSNGHQPTNFLNFSMVYNGEIYNFKEIRLELIELGYIFESNSDTEVVLKAYHKWGLQSIHKFNGMFAIAIFDRESCSLTLIRDRAGVKPLYWYYNDGLFMFASELKSFHEHPRFQKKIDHDGFSLFLQYGYIPQPHTIFKDAKKLNAGHFLKLNLKNSEFNVSKYWDITDCYNQKKLDVSEEEALYQTESLLKSACEYRMISDVPVGVFLSGGYDSSLVAALLQHDRSEKIKTFSIGFHDKRLNEAHYARRVANHLSTDHIEYYCTQKDALRVLSSFSEIWDEPFADNSAIPTVILSELAREKVTVSLSADGGDELFGGYNKYIQAGRYFKLFGVLPKKAMLVKFLQSVNPFIFGLDILESNLLEKYRHVMSVMESNSPSAAMQNMQKIFSQDYVQDIILSTFSSAITSFDDLKNLNVDLTDLDKMMAIDFKTYQLDDILTKVDRATMSVGLEGREPLLDFRLIEYVTRLNSNLKIKKGEKKYLLKKIAHKYLPKEMMDRPKMGFTAPIDDWFLGGLKYFLEEFFDPCFLKSQGIFDAEYVISLKNRYLKGEGYLIGKIWVILVFQMWYKRWMT